MDERDEAGITHLAIVRRGQYATYDLLKKGFESDRNVTIIWDRRVGSRRVAQHTVSDERRHADRRQTPIGNWQESDFLVLSLGEEQPPVVRPADASEAFARFPELHADIECAARLELPVLVTGGDERVRLQVAEFVHGRSVRRRGPFVVLMANWDAVAQSMNGVGMQGSSTSLERSLDRAMQRARGGTLYVPEVADLSVHEQAELVQHLAHRPPSEAGGPDARVIAATQHDLTANIRAGALRSDLFYYLNPLHLIIPAADV